MDLAEATGLSKRTVQNALAWLQHRKLVTASRASATEVPAYRVHAPWRR
jgi:DNA-binding GntR family transcriptional regulator